ncbi:unnamed protein product, partial [Closterium sp. Naga37s-1]
VAKSTGGRALPLRWAAMCVRVAGIWRRAARIWRRAAVKGRAHTGRRVQDGGERAGGGNG